MPTSGFVLLVYRLPTKPTAPRVAVWRQLKKVGAVYLQQSVCVFPDTGAIHRELQPVLTKIDGSLGTYNLIPLHDVPAAEQDKLIAEFRAQSAKRFQEIVENCEVNFQKEIEFETFRQNFTYEEAEEIRAEYDKIVRWFQAVRRRDWFGAPNQSEARRWLGRCKKLLEGFEENVFRAQGGEVEVEVDSTSDRRPTRSRPLRSRRLRATGA